MDVVWKNVKVNKTLSEETICFSASLYLTGKRIGVVMNRGHGGPPEFEFVSKEAEPEFLSYAEAYADEVGRDDYSPWGTAVVLVDDALERHQFREFAKNPQRRACPSVRSVARGGTALAGSARNSLPSQTKRPCNGISWRKALKSARSLRSNDSHLPET